MTSTYETVAGTEPVANGVHEPRTVKRIVTQDERFDKDDDLHMMTEIGDGVFVQWSNCRKCSKRVYDCKCTGGPVAPDHIAKWLNDRFKGSFNDRPDPSYELIPSMISWIEERGYTVTKSLEKQIEEAVPYDPDAEPPLTLEEEEVAGFLSDTPEQIGEALAELTTQVDSGLDEALARVREAKLDDEVGF
jgi:hypothetical protein